MIDFIIKLENMLEQSGYEDWEISKVKIINKEKKKNNES